MFQDRNVEVLRDVALSNALCNVGAATCRERARFVMGDWSCVGKCLRQPLFTPKHDRTAATAEVTLQYDLIVTTETVYSPVCVPGTGGVLVIMRAHLACECLQLLRRAM